MKLLVITPAKDVADETNIVTKMFESGLTTLHLRKPRYSTNQMANYIKEIPIVYHNRIVIHSHHKLAIKFNLKGIHLTNMHLSKKWKYWYVRLRLRLKFGAISKSRSYSRLQQTYNTEEHSFNYFLLGTMFNSLTGGFYSGFYEEGVRAAIKNNNKKFVARGGTTPDIIKKAKDMGFFGIAFNSFIWDSETPYNTFLKITEIYRESGIELE